MSGSHNPLNPQAVADFLVNNYDDAEDAVAELTDSTDMDMNLAKKLVGAWSKLDVMKRHQMGFKEKDMVAWVNSVVGKQESNAGKVKELKSIIESGSYADELAGKGEPSVDAIVYLMNLLKSSSSSAYNQGLSILGKISSERYEELIDMYQRGAHRDFKSLLVKFRDKAAKQRE